MELAIDNRIYNQALETAQRQGLNLNTMIEKYLVRFIGKSQQTSTEAIPDVVLSLLGAAEPTDSNDLNGRDAYYQYLEEKYK